MTNNKDNTMPNLTPDERYDIIKGFLLRLYTAVEMEESMGAPREVSFLKMATNINLVEDAQAMRLMPKNAPWVSDSHKEIIDELAEMIRDEDEDKTIH